MKSKRVFPIAALAVIALFVIAAAGCKTSGMAVTSRGQLLKLDIVHPKDLPERGEDNLDVVLGSRGVNNVKDVLLDVELPPQLIVLDETHERSEEHTSELQSQSNLVCRLLLEKKKKKKKKRNTIPNKTQKMR